MSNLKQQLYILCVEYLKKQETEIKKTIAEAQEAANEETKSSAGDKFETGREIMQQDIDLNLMRMNQLDKMKDALEKILPGQISSTAVPGSVVRTNNGNYYIAISAGQLKLDGATYFAISIASPIGAKIAGKKTGEEFELNGKKYIIESVL
jgi:transcription elongation GreA/GreB family factor